MSVLSHSDSPGPIRSSSACRRLLIAVFVLGFRPPVASAEPITGIVSFGDSLSDTGNLFAATGQPPAPYYQGRFSNGPVWVEHLAQALGLAAPTPSVLGGTDYAWGGAETGSGTVSGGIANMGLQVASYLAGNTPLPTQLFTLWGGGNDFFDGQTNPSVPVSNIGSEITSLAGAGARMFMVLNLPQLGDVPGSLGLPQAQRDGLSQLSLAFDTSLHAELDQLRQGLGVTIFEIDVNGLLQRVQANPSAYGFANATTGAVNDGVLSGQGYLFWDDVHPTTQAHERLAEAALRVLRVPQAP